MIEQDLKDMLAEADDLDEARDKLWLEEMLTFLMPGNRIYEWIAAIMRKHGWREAYETLAAYAADGCGMRG